MKKIRVVQFGMTHEHANGKMSTLRKMPETYEIVGVVDDRNLKTTKCFGDLSIFDGIPILTEEEAFRTPGLDAVFVEVPNLELVPTALRCMEHNLPMHIDKPAGEDLALFKKLLDGAEKRHLAIQMGYMFRGNPAMQFCRKLIRNGTLGEIIGIDMDMSHSYGGDDYDRYLAGFKGGVMFNLGCHLIDFIVSAMGVPERAVPFLQSTANVCADAKNNTLSVLEYPHASVTLRVCGKRTMEPVSRRRLCAEGTAGWLEISPLERYDDKPLEVTLGLKNDTASFPAGIHVLHFPQQKDRYMEQLAEFARILRKEESNPYTYEHDYQVQKVTLEASGYLV